MKFLFATAFIASAATVIQAVIDENNINWIKSGNICGGIKVDEQGSCSGHADCTFTAIGICPGSANTSKAYFANNFKNIGFVKKANYLNNENCDAPDAQSTDCYNVPPNETAFYRDFNSNESAPNGASYAYSQAGSYFGNDEQGGYVGVANYLVTGSESFQSNVNKFYVASSSDEHSFQSIDRSDAGGSDIGAPLGPFLACIAPIADGACGSDITFKPRQSKFSFFGITDGTQWDSRFQYLKGAADSFLVRMEMQLYGAANNAVTFNDGKTLAEVAAGNIDLESVHLKLNLNGEDLTVRVDFKKYYNYGNLADWQPDAMPAEVPTSTSMTKSITIRAKAVSGSSDKFYLDYLMDAADFANVKSYAVYDPVISIENTTDSSTTGATISTKSSMSTTTKASMSTTAAKLSGATMLSASFLCFIAMVAAAIL